MNSLHQVLHSDSLDTDASSAPLEPSTKLLVATGVATLLGFALSVASIALFTSQVGASVTCMTLGICFALMGFVVADRFSSVLFGKAIAIEGALIFAVGLVIMLRFIGIIDLVLSSFR